MARFKQHPKTLELIPIELWDDTCHSGSSGIHVIDDIQPYRSMIDGSVINSRSQHRRHLRDHGCIEVGNDSTIGKPQRKPLESPPGLRETLIGVAMEKLRY